MKFSRTEAVKYILFFTFLANAFLGYPYTNFLISPIPLNEILLLLALLFINKNIITVITKYPVILPLLVWSLSYLLLSVPFGFLKYGIWAGRDATHLIEVWWIVVALYLFDRIDLKKELQKALKIISTLFIVKFLIILGGDSIKGIFVIHGAQGDIDIFGSETGINVILFLLLFSWFIGLYRKIANILLAFGLIAILQGRTIYVGLLSSIILYMAVFKVNFKRIIQILLALIVMIFILYAISFMTFLDEYTRFGIGSIAPDKIILHLIASTGSSEEYASSAHGTTQRISWFLMNWERAMDDGVVFLFGQGFGPVLTDFSTINIVREPHNSYLSIFARTGLIGLIMWLTFHIYINTKVFLTLRKNRKFIKNSIYLKYLFVSFFTMNAMYWFSLVEPGFESPQTCINFYILLGLMVYLSRIHIIKKVKYV